MTAVATSKDGSKAEAASSRTPIVFIPFLLGVAMLIGYFVLPFINQPELGATTIPLLTADRGNNELDVITNGLRLLWLSGVVVTALGVWSIYEPRVDRTVSVLTVIGGIVALTYYVIFYMDYRAEEATFFSSIGISFWVMIAAAVLMILQVVIPRGQAAKHFEVQYMLGNQETVLILGIVALLVVVGITNPRFLAERNLLDVLQGNAYIAVAAIGMSVVIVTGNIDISVGSLIGLLAVISGRLVVNGAPVIIAWTLPILIGVGVGAFIGALVAYLRVPSIVVTLGMLSILKGILIIWTNGERVTGMPEAFFLAQQRYLGVSVPIWTMIILTILAAIWMRYSQLGRSLYAVGGNAEAARLSGISPRTVVLQAFMINGLFTGVAAVLYATQFQVIQATPPPSLELFIITAAVVGGVSILGGVGTVIGATLAAILLNMIRSALVFINVSPFWIQAVQGTLILVTVLADLLRRRRQRQRG